MKPLRHIVLAPLLLAAACSDPMELTVDVRTDWQPVAEFVEVRTELAPEPFASVGTGQVRQVGVEPMPGDDFFYGVRVAEFDDVSEGQRYVRVSLVDGAGEVVASRTVDLSLQESFALTVVMTRNCRDRVCPAAGDDPSHTACLDGQCVDPRCSASTPEHCGEPACEVDSDCTGRADCAEGRCSFGVCLCGSPPDDAGVVERDAGTDAGPRPDTGPGCSSTETACTDGEDDDCDGMIDCADPDCNGASCDDGDACTEGDTCSAGTCGGSSVSCNDSNPCTDDSCDPSSGCINRNNSASCNDGDACTTGDICSGGSCSGSTRSCDDGNPCTTDSCNSSTGCVNSPRADHTTCGGANLRCCGGSCVHVLTSEAHCGGCGLACASGLTCSEVTSGGRTSASCRTCTANSQCPPSGATCWAVSLGGSGRCQCQSSSHCASGQTCYTGSGDNYCYYP